MSTKRIHYQTKIAKIIDHNALVRELFIDFIQPDHFGFKAGQFVMLQIPSENSEKPVQRAYSIASNDREKKQMRLIFKFIPGGIASTFIWNLKEHEELSFTGPFGRVLFEDNPSKNNYFLCTGTGLAQHYCFFQSKLDLHPDCNFHLIFGNRDESQLFYLKELEALKKSYKNFYYHAVLSRPSNGWNGPKGHVQDQLNKIGFDTNNSSFYLCGNGSMVREMKNNLIEIHKIQPDKVHYEIFY